MQKWAYQVLEYLVRFTLESHEPHPYAEESHKDSVHKCSLPQKLVSFLFLRRMTSHLSSPTDSDLH